MSELGTDTMRGVPWPSNGLTEIPFRLYTDPEQYAARAGADLQGSDLELPVSDRRDPQFRRLRRDDDRRDRGDRYA